MAFFLMSEYLCCFHFTLGVFTVLDYLLLDDGKTQIHAFVFSHLD